jgi:hypothetical protein
MTEVNNCAGKAQDGAARPAGREAGASDGTVRGVVATELTGRALVSATPGCCVTLPRGTVTCVVDMAPPIRRGMLYRTRSTWRHGAEQRYRWAWCGREAVRSRHKSGPITG